ncbi:MAG: hypothetical protein ABSF45_25290 [Terriglobia bacterium]|jgi:hypothetical protein
MRSEYQKQDEYKRASNENLGTCFAMSKPGDNILPNGSSAHQATIDAARGIKWSHQQPKAEGEQNHKKCAES